MATKGTEIVELPESKSLPTKLAKFVQAMGQLKMLKSDLDRLDQEARTIKLTNRAEFDRASVINQERREAVKQAEGIVKPFKEPLRKWIDFIQQNYNEVKNEAEVIGNVIEPKMTLWTQEDDRQRKAEEDRINKELRERNARDAEAQRQADIKAAAEDKKKLVVDIKRLYRTGEITKSEYVTKMRAADAALEVIVEAAEIEKDARIANTPVASVESTVKKGRTWHHAECADEEVFIREAIDRARAGDRSMMRFITVDNAALDDEAERVKDDEKMATMYPGVKAWSKVTHL